MARGMPEGAIGTAGAGVADARGTSGDCTPSGFFFGCVGFLMFCTGNGGDAAMGAGDAVL